MAAAPALINSTTLQIHITVLPVSINAKPAWEQQPIAQFAGPIGEPLPVASAMKGTTMME